MNPDKRMSSLLDYVNKAMKPEIIIKKQVTVDYGDHQYNISTDGFMITITYGEDQETGMRHEFLACELYADKAKVIFAEALKLLGE